MNIRRGLFRLWVAVSALWMAIVCVAFWDQLSVIFTVVEPPQGQGTVVLSLGDHACWLTRHTEFVSFVDPFDPEKPTTLLQAWRMCVAHKAQVPAIALGPPLAVFAFALVIGWIAKGFHRITKVKGSVK
jgi:hypothetical protein